MSPLVLSIMQLAVALVMVGTIVLVWAAIYHWFADNRELNNEFPRSATSWDDSHLFFDKITEFRNDFA